MLIAMMLALAAGQAAPAQKTEPVAYLFADGRDTNPDLLRPALGKDMGRWTTPADYPTTGLDKEGKGEVRATVRICPIVRQRGKFSYALDRAGKPAADQVSLVLVFAPRQLPPAPYPSDWTGVNPDLLRSTANMRITREPDWARFAPAGFSGKADLAVKVRLYSARGGGFQTVCIPLDWPVDQALSDATCKALATAGYQTRAGEDFSAITMLVRWNKGKASIKMPDRAGTSLVFDRMAAETVPGRPAGATDIGWMVLRFPADGKQPACQITRSTGSDAGDVAACEHAESLPYTAPVDIFGRKLRAEQRLSPRFAR